MFGGRDPAWQADMARVGVPRAFFKEQSLWAIWVYRFGQRVDRRPAGIRRDGLLRVYWLLFRVVETLTGISLPKSCTIGQGLRIWHFGNVFLNANAVLGKNCTLRQGVTIGNREDGGGSPILGDNVELGAYAQLLGDIRIGNNCKIGAMALVLTDIPPGSTAVGQPARIVTRHALNPVTVAGEPAQPIILRGRRGND